MNNTQKNTAPRAATPETAQLKNNLNISITDNPEKIKVIHQAPGRISCVMFAEIKKIDSLMKKYKRACLFDFENGCVYVFPDNIITDVNRENANISYNNKIYYGECYVVGISPETTDSKAESFEYISLKTPQIQSARAWLMKHSV